MSPPIRTERILQYRTLVNRTFVTALANVFTNGYKERQFDNLKITPQFPLARVEYPAILIEFEDSRIVNAGVGHEEWFDDPNGTLRKWHHRRFEGTISFTTLTLSPLDRDMLADALVEILSFGRLDTALLPFFWTVFGNPHDPFTEAALFSQLSLNTDEISGLGNNAAPAPWAPEDVLVYTTGYSLELHGGFYNSLPLDEWQILSRVSLAPYPQGEINVDESFDFEPAVPPLNLYPDLAWTNPFTYEDGVVVVAQAEPSGNDVFVAAAAIYEDSPAMVFGVGSVSATEHFLPSDSGLPQGVARIEGAESYNNTSTGYVAFSLAIGNVQSVFYLAGGFDEGVDPITYAQATQLVNWIIAHGVSFIPGDPLPIGAYYTHYPNGFYDPPPFDDVDRWDWSANGSGLDPHMDLPWLGPGNGSGGSGGG